MLSYEHSTASKGAKQDEEYSQAEAKMFQLDLPNVNPELKGI